MSEKLKNLGESITSAYGVVESHIRKHFWYILVILLVTVILTLAKGSDSDRLSIASSVLSIALALIVVILSIVHACDMKAIVQQGWKEVANELKDSGYLIPGEGVKFPTVTDSSVQAATATEYQFDPARVTWMTLSVLCCISKAQEKGKQINKMGFSSTIDGALRQELNLNYTVAGVYGLLEGVIYGMMCFLPEGYIMSVGDTVEVKKLPKNFAESVEKGISEAKESQRGKEVFGVLCPAIDAYFQ